jgi:hypothetical protein
MDCSTFAFDLHVLGTPPALILSQDQTLMLKSSPFEPLTSKGSRCEESNSLTRGRLALRCSIRCRSMSWSPPVASARTDDSGQPLAATPRAGLLSHVPCGTIDGLCACTHYPVFKEPTVRAPVAPSPCFLATKRFSAFLRPRLGEPFKVTSSVQPCQPRNRRHEPTSYCGCRPSFGGLLREDPDSGFSCGPNVQ